MNTGTRIKKLRKEQHLTQTYLAKKVGITKAAISKYEKNLVKNIPNDKLQKIAKALNTSTQYLLGLQYLLEQYQNCYCYSTSKRPSCCTQHEPDTDKKLKNQLSELQKLHHVMKEED